MSRTSQTKPSLGRNQNLARPRGLAAASAAMEEVARVEVIDTPTTKAKKPKPKTRDGKKGLVLYVLPEVTLALRKLALEHNSDVQRMGWRALELLFAECKAHLPGGKSTVSKS